MRYNKVRVRDSPAFLRPTSTKTRLLPARAFTLHYNFRLHWDARSRPLIPPTQRWQEQEQNLNFIFDTYLSLGILIIIWDASPTFNILPNVCKHPIITWMCFSFTEYSFKKGRNVQDNFARVILKILFCGWAPWRRHWKSLACKNLSLSLSCTKL